jgi:hypothetical protein
MALSLLVLPACGGSATARLKLHDATQAKAAKVGAGPRAAARPSEVGYRMTAVYVAEEIDPATGNNVGMTSMIWLAPECGDEIETCKPAGEAGPGPRVSTYFDFARGTDQVNAQLNSQDRPVTPGSYRYVRVEFCKIQPGEQPAQPNVRWQVQGMAGPRAFSLAMCGVTSQPFDKPMLLAAGDAIEVTLDYDLDQMVVSGPPQAGSGQCIGAPGAQRCFLDCADVGGVRYCLDAPRFTPSASSTHAGPPVAQ